MFGLIKKVFIALLGFSKSLAIKFVSLNNELCVTRPRLVDSNPVEPKYYSYMISLEKLNVSCNTVNYLSMRRYAPSKRKYRNVNVFNMITNRKETKTLVKHISCDFKCKLNSLTCNSNQKWKKKTCRCECKKYCTCKKDCSSNTSTSICDNGKNLKKCC